MASAWLQNAGLVASEEHSHVPAVGVFVERFAFLVDGDHFLQLHQHHVGAAVVPQADRAEHEHRFHRRGQLHRRGDGLLGRRGEIVEHPPQVVGDGGCLLLLALHRHSLGAATCLQVERPRARLAERADGERIHLIEVEVHAHAGRT